MFGMFDVKNVRIWPLPFNDPSHSVNFRRHCRPPISSYEAELRKHVVCIGAVRCHLGR